MADEPSSGTGTGGHVSVIQFWSAIIPLIFMGIASVVTPLYQMYLSSRHETNRVEQAKKTDEVLKEVAEKSDTNHEVLKDVIAGQREAVDKLSVVAEKIPVEDRPKPVSE